MANKVEILDLDINTSALIAKMTQTRSEIDKLKSSQKALAEQGKQNSDAFSKNEVELKRLQTSYSQQKNVVAQLTSESNKFATASIAIASAINQENTSIAQARANNTQLLALRNQLNLKTDEGKKKLQEINAKLDENNAYIKENVSAYEQQKIGIGDYRTAITGALQDAGLFGGQMQSVSQTLSSFTPLLGAMKDEFNGGATQIRNSASATEGMTLAQKALAVATNLGTGAMRIFTVALASTGIGLIVIAVALLIGYFKTFDPLIDKIEQAMAGFGGAVRVVQVTLGQFISGITSVGDALNKLGAFLKNPIGALKDLGNEMANTAKEAMALKEAQQELADLQNSQEVANAKASQQYNELILKSKNRTLSEKERLDFLQQAEKIEEANFKQRSNLADREINNAIKDAKIKGQLNKQEVKNLQEKGMAYALYLLNLGKITDAEVEAIKKATLSKIAIADESTKRLEKNQNAQDKLEEDRKAKADKAKQDAEKAQQDAETAKQKRIDETIQKSKDELELFIQQQGIKRKSLEDEIAFEKQILAKKLAILKQEYDAKKISKTAFEAQSLALTNEYAKKEVDITIAEAQRELDNFKKNHQLKIEQDKFFSEEKFKKLISDNELVRQKESEYQLQRLNDGIINQSEYNDAIDLINEQARIRREEAENTRKEAKKEQEAIDIENKRASEELSTSEAIALELQKNEEARQRELENAEKTGADKALINAKYDKYEQDITKKGEMAKVAMAQQTLGQIAGLLGESTAAGKAAALAMATINMYEGITAELATKAKTPYEIGLKIANVAIVAGVGLKNIQKINATKTPKFADGGEVPTLQSGVIDNGANLSVPLSNGDNTLAYVKQGEIILNKDQQRKAGGNLFFRNLGVPGFAGGGIVGGNTNIPTPVNGIKIDYDMLASAMASANASLPAPVVSVQEISTASNRVKTIEAGANF